MASIFSTILTTPTLTLWPKPTSNNNVSHATESLLLLGLPDEILLHVFSFIGVAKLPQIMTVSSAFQSLALRALFGHFNGFSKSSKDGTDDFRWPFKIGIAEIFYYNGGLGSFINCGNVSGFQPSLSQELYEGYSDRLWDPASSVGLPTRSLRLALEDAAEASRNLTGVQLDTPWNWYEPSELNGVDDPRCQFRTSSFDFRIFLSRCLSRRSDVAHKSTG